MEQKVKGFGLKNTAPTLLLRDLCVTSKLWGRELGTSKARHIFLFLSVHFVVPAAYFPSQLLLFRVPFCASRESPLQNLCTMESYKACGLPVTCLGKLPHALAGAVGGPASQVSAAAAVMVPSLELDFVSLGLTRLQQESGKLRQRLAPAVQPWLAKLGQQDMDISRQATASPPQVLKVVGVAPSGASSNPTLVVREVLHSGCCSYFQTEILLRS